MTPTRRGSTDLSGVLVIDKPSGLTSHDVVALVRRATGERRVGHAGTLDPAATGVLIVLVGPATRLAPSLTAQRKTYEARIVFGTRTDTDDADGVAVETAPVPESLSDRDAAARIVSALVGDREQLPPAYSAIKKGGRVAHRAARAGEPLVLEPRPIDIVSAELVRIDAGPPVAWIVRVEVSKGTYIRSLARDIGEDLGTVAHLGGLRRLSSGAATLDLSYGPDDLSSAMDVRSRFTDPVPLLGFPVLDVDEDDARAVSNGRSLALQESPSSDEACRLVSVVHDDRLLAIYGSDPQRSILKPVTVLAGGIAR